MEIDTCADRRAFLSTALATLAVVTAQASQEPEIPSIAAELPPGATLWGLVVFTGVDPIEMVIAAGKAVKTLRGRFSTQRLTEYSFRNDGRSTETIRIRAKAMAGDRELVASKI